MKKIRFRTFNDKLYKITWTRKPIEYNGKAYGLCYPPNSTKPEIKIGPGQDEKRLLKTLIDEITHAHFWCLGNDEVHKFSEELGEFLYDTGYRLKNQDKK